jgi:CHAT domain-containing protein
MLAKAPPAAKTSLIVAMSDIYAGQFALAAGKLNRPSLGFEVVERARGRVATDLIRSGIRETPEQAREVERQISALHLQLTRAKTRAEVRRLRDRIFLAEQSRWVLPNTWRDHVRESVPVKLSELQKTLSAKDMLLEYVLAEPASFCLVVTRDQVRVVRLPERAKIEQLIKDYVQGVKAKRPARELGQKVYRTLLAGVPGLRMHTRLIVVGDGYLHLLPFDSLVTPSGQFLVRTHTVTTATSATAFYLQGDEARPGVDGGSVLAVGGVPYEAGSAPKVSLFRRGSSGALGNLPSSEDEAFAATEAMKGLDSMILTGRKATEAAFKQADLERQRAIHLAVHGIADQTHPDRAGLVMLSSPSAQEDGILHGSEIVQLRLNADLVVLSACDTAVGRLLGQEGIGTLSRAFQLAGARSVVSTLWSTDDTFSLHLMKRFYARIARGETLAVALAGAKRDLLNEFGSRAVPYYWAGFVLSGAADRPLTTVTARGKAKETYAAH